MKILYDALSRFRMIREKEHGNQNIHLTVPQDQASIISMQVRFGHKGFRDFLNEIGIPSNEELVLERFSVDDGMG